MNKKFFTALMATILMAVSAIAQNNNTYSMVLKLTGGTVITIGPNELEQLDFKEGDVTATGTSITQLVNNIKAMQAKIAMLEQQTAANKADIQAAVNAVQNQVVASNANIDALNAKVNVNQNAIAAVSEQVQASNASIAALNAQVNVNQNAIAAVSQRVQASNDDIAALQALIQKHIADAEDIIRVFEQEISYLMEQVNQ